MERQSGFNDSIRKCYSDILPLYENMMDPDELKLRWDYVEIALLAEDPRAEALREQFIQDAGDNPIHWYEKQVLKYYSRESVITGKVPPEIAEILENPPPIPDRRGAGSRDPGFPDHTYYQYQKCLTLERQSGFNDSMRKCYSDILSLYENMTDPDERKRCWPYVEIALLAEDPKAEALREQFIQDAGDNPVYWHEKQFLKYHSREMVINGEFPAELREILENPPPIPDRRGVDSK